MVVEEEVEEEGEEPVEDAVEYNHRVNMARVVPLRTAAKEESMDGGQGVPKCNCTGNCLNARYSCKKESRRCNSRCHNKRSCANVDAFIG